MASVAQIEANRLNAGLSSGPTSCAGKARSSRNHLKFGLFSTQNCVRPDETAEYTKLSKALWRDLNPVGPVEQMLAVEIVRAAWRFHRCALAEAEDGETPATQASVDRARASAPNAMRRLLTDWRQFQSDRWLRAEVLRGGFDEASLGIADAQRRTFCRSKSVSSVTGPRRVMIRPPPGCTATWISRLGIFLRLVYEHYISSRNR